MKSQTRREFLVESVKMLGVIMGTTALGKEFLLPEVAKAEDILFPASNCGSKNKGGRKILITYASKFGTTGEVAEAIGDVLCQAGNTVETKYVRNVKDLTNYDAVIIGSPIHKNTWMSEAKEFVKANQKKLQQLPVFYFYTCLFLNEMNQKRDLEARECSDTLKALVPPVKPVSIGGFAGVLDYTHMGFFHRMALKVILSGKGLKEGDYRDWNAIRVWAQETQLKINLALRTHDNQN